VKKQYVGFQDMMPYSMVLRKIFMVEIFLHFHGSKIYAFLQFTKKQLGIPRNII